MMKTAPVIDSQRLEKEIADRLASQALVVLALDGPAGSGKSGLAADLYDRFGGAVIHLDDFFMPWGEDGGDDLAPNIDQARLLAEVLEPLQAGRAGDYQVFSCRTQSRVGKRPFPAQGLVVVEGSFSLLPRFAPYYDLKLLLELSAAEQTRRLQRREGANYAFFRDRWLPPEVHYARATKLNQRADFRLDGDGETKTVFHLVRHAETRCNSQLLLQGQHDSGLSERGLRQAQALSGRLVQLAPHRIVASDLGRAYHTAARTALRLPGVPLTAEPAFREIHLGELEGQTYESCFERFPVVMATMKDQPSAVVTPGGESGAQVMRRALQGLDRLRQAHPGERIQIVSHGFVLNLLLQGLAQRHGLAWQPTVSPNTGVSRLVFTGDRLAIDYVNDTRHLPDEG